MNPLPKKHKVKQDEEMPDSPVYGERLLPQVVDYHASKSPNRIYGSYAIAHDISQGFRNVTMKEMASAVNCLAWWIKDNIGTSRNFETLVYMGITDLRYPMMCLAAIKCGFKIMLPGTRNAIVQINGLIERTGCRNVVHSAEMAPIVNQLVVENKLHIPTLDNLLASEVPHYPYDKTFNQAQNDPILVVHSSGTTGNPKIVVMTHGTVSVTDRDRFIGCPPGRKPQNAAQFNFGGDGAGFYSCFPPYHLAGLQATLILPILSESASIILGPPLVPPSGELVATVIEKQRGFIKAFYVPPIIIDQWSQTPDALEAAKDLNFILYGGGVLPKSVGDALSQVTDVCQMYGSVETGQIQLLVPEKGYWEYMEFNPFEEVDMQPSDDGAYEMVLHQEEKFKKHRSISHNFPDLKEWRSGDLFVQHPTKLGLWQYHGRMDDLIVLANSHKINPVAFETGMLNHPMISGALMVGTGRAQPALLLELTQEAASKTEEELMLEVWPLVENANALVPQYGVITKSKIVFGDPKKPFIRAPKGSIVRKPTIALYASEIESAYSGTLSGMTVEERQLDSPEAIKTWIQSVFNALLPETKLEDDDDIFAGGLDSLKIAELTNILRHASRPAQGESTAITAAVIYQHPTINQLASAISSIILDDISMNRNAEPSMDSLVQRYTQLPSLSQKRFVILTGATGSLGSQVLRRLLLDPEIEKVYCLVRWKPGRHIDTLRKNYRETFPKLASRVKFVEVDFSKEKLGVNDEIYNLICSGIDAIIHLAWMVDFNLSLQSFEKTHLRGLQSLISISVNSRRKPPIVFASSAAYAVSWAISQGTNYVPESLLPIDENVSCTGYGKSKHVAELILAAASQQHGVPVTILRLGQIAGSDTSVANVVPRAWSKNEWVPSMIQTAKSLNLIPTSQIPIDWVPGSNVADIIGEVVSSGIKTETPSLQVANVVHDNAVPWTSFVHALQQELPFAEVVSMREWVSALDSHDANDPSQLVHLPALKLKDYFEGLAKFDDLGEGSIPRFEVNTAHALSKTIGKFLDAINDDVIRRWVKEFI